MNSIQMRWLDYKISDVPSDIKTTRKMCLNQTSECNNLEVRRYSLKVAKIAITHSIFSKSIKPKHIPGHENLLGLYSDKNV